MQDRQQNDMDPAFVDYAWEQMRAQLDEAMPVEDRRRKRGFLLWFFVFLILGGAWVTLRAFSTDAIKESKQPQQEQPIANRQEQVDLLRERSSDPVLESTAIGGNERAAIVEQPTADVQDEAPTSFPQEYVHSTNPNDLPTSPSLAQPTDIKKGEIISSESSTSTIQTPTEERIATPLSTTPQTATEIALANTDDNVQEDAKGRDQWSTLAAVPTLDLQPIREEGAKELPASPSSLNRPLHLFADGSVGLGLDDAAQLLQLGVGAQLAISPRLALEGGLAYQAYHIGDFSSLIGKQDAEFISFEEVGAGGWSGANYAVTVPFDSAVSSVVAHRLALPLSVRWSPSAQSRWRLCLGGSAAYYLQALVESELPESFGATERSAVTNFDLYNQDQPLFVLDSSAEDISNPAGFIARPLEVARWEWSWTAAVAYRFSGRLEGQVQYRGLLNNWPNDKERLGPNSFAQLSLRYYLK